MPNTERNGLPSPFEVLVHHAVPPLLVIDAAGSGLTVVAANEAARVQLGHGQDGASLAEWIGEPSANVIATAIELDTTDGFADGWRWQLATLEARPWVICEAVTGDAKDAAPATRHGARDQRLVQIYEAALAVGSDLTIETVLQRIADVARQVVPARYAALGITDERGKILQFITSGISPEERAAIGPLPEGHGLLGVLISDGQPLLIPDIDADPRSHGFPPNHPPMRTLLGVPIKHGERVLGDLYLTERTTGTPFTQQDLTTLQVLAEHAATAIERATLHHEVQVARDRAEEQRDRLRTILDNIPSAIIIATPPDGAVELANTAANRLIFGEDDEHSPTLTHLRDFRVFESEGLPLAHELRPGMRALRNLIVRNQQLLIECPDGQRIPVLTQATPIHDAKGNVKNAVIVFQDITRLREAEQLKDDFLSLISHEFRTPLTTIQGGAYLLANQRTALDDETLQHLLTDIVVESERLDRMLHNMLSLAAIMAGRLTAATEPVLLNPLVHGMIAEVAHRSPNHAFVADLPTGLPPGEADPDLLNQVLRNLYENAVKYSPDGGEIRTTIECDGGTVTLNVSDQGLGIAPEYVPHVFERFRRPGADPTVRGMGLGLYLSRSLVEVQRGTIRATSAGPGQGSTFSVTLPIARDWASPAEERASMEC